MAREARAARYWLCYGLRVVGTGYLSPSNFHAFLYAGGKMTDIDVPKLCRSPPTPSNTLIPAGAGFTLTNAVAIHDSVQILCDVKNATGSERAVLLSSK